ncbi:MAG: hypothetical protein WBD36_01435 [Bacteroidota bacterium]
MGRRIIYRIRNDGKNVVDEQQWAEILRIQHWYNSEFLWSTGKISFKRYIAFPNTEEFSDLNQSVWEILAERQKSLRSQGLTERQIIEQLEKDQLVFVKWGGYFDGCLASGFTRVADNEWNAFLVCDFLLKASTICPRATIQVEDEGQFIKTGTVWLQGGSVLLPRNELRIPAFVEEMREDRHIFSIVDPGKYQNHPRFFNSIPNFNGLRAPERRTLVQNWNWLGYGDSYDSGGDDKQGYDLNKKVKAFQFVE